MIVMCSDIKKHRKGVNLYDAFDKSIVLLSKQPRGGEIARAGVGRDGNDKLSCVFGTAGEAFGGKYCRTGGYSAEYAVCAADITRSGICILCRDSYDFIVSFGIKRFRNKACADSLKLVSACAST